MDFVQAVSALIDDGASLRPEKGKTIDDSRYKAWEMRVLNVVRKLNNSASFDAYNNAFDSRKMNGLGGKISDVLALLYTTRAQIKNGEIVVKSSVPQATSAMRKQYDVFLSHANKDKLTYVDSLYIALRKLGINIFYDSDVLSWGDNWKEAILNGVAQSEFAIVVISRDFFGREWTERELNEFLQRQNEGGQKLILPLLYEISFDELKKHYPALESIQSLKNTETSADDIAILLAKELIKRYK